MARGRRRQLQLWAKTDGGGRAADVGELPGTSRATRSRSSLSVSAERGAFARPRRARSARDKALDAFEQQLGVSLDDVTGLLRGEASSTSARALIPEVTLVAKTDGAQGADGRRAAEGRQPASRAASRARPGSATSRRREAASAARCLLRRLDDDRVVVSTSKRGIEDLRDGRRPPRRRRRLPGRARRGRRRRRRGRVRLRRHGRGLRARGARGAARRPDLPPDVRENLEPLRAVVVAASCDKDKSRGSSSWRWTSRRRAPLASLGRHGCPRLPLHLRVGHRGTPGQDRRPDLGLRPRRRPRGRPERPRRLRDARHHRPRRRRRRDLHRDLRRHPAARPPDGSTRSATPAPSTASTRRRAA